MTIQPEYIFRKVGDKYIYSTLRLGLQHVYSYFSYCRGWKRFAFPPFYRHFAPAYGRKVPNFAAITDGERPAQGGAGGCVRPAIGRGAGADPRRCGAAPSPPGARCALANREKHKRCYFMKDSARNTRAALFAIVPVSRKRSLKPLAAERDQEAPET